MTKRQHALHQLLSSERAYASDLALIRDIHLPLALGECLISLSFSFASDLFRLAAAVKYQVFGLFSI